MRLRRWVFAAAAFAAVVATGPATARADDEGEFDEALAGDIHSSYWFASFFGGLMAPVSTMQDTHERGLVATARFGFTGRNGVGLAATGSYSPLPGRVPEDALPDTSISTHFAVLTATPRFTLGHKQLRIWLGGGGGIVLERSKVSVGGTEMSTDTQIEPAATADAGLELHVFGNGGFALGGTYTHSFGDIDSRAVSALAGLVFTFE